MERKTSNFQPRRGVCVAEKSHNRASSNMVMRGMTNVAKPRSSDATYNILASFGESKGISTMNPSCDKVLDVEEEAWSNKEPSGQNIPFNANGQNVSFNANGQNVSPNHAEFNVSFNANGQNVSYNHAEFNVFPNSANGLNVIPDQKVDYENFAKGIERGTYEVWLKLTRKQHKAILKTCHDAWNALLNSQLSEFPSLVRTSDNDGRTSPSNLNSPSNAARFWEGIHHVKKEISAFSDANSDYDDEAPVDDGANPDVEAFYVSTYGVDAMSNSYTGYESILNGTHHVTHVETDTESEFLIQNIDDVAKFFGVPLSSLKEIDDFTRELEAGNNQLWLGQTMDIRNWISDLIVEKCLELQKKAIMVENKPVPGRRFRLMALVG
ncbi:hypothetical protein Tco_1452971 [Tanacetum coccineum]